MKLFVWKYVENATDSWHTEGGIAVVALNLEAARAALIGAGVPSACAAFSTPPDRTLLLAEDPEQEVFVFPNAGCC